MKSTTDPQESMNPIDPLLMETGPRLATSPRLPIWTVWITVAAALLGAVALDGLNDAQAQAPSVVADEPDSDPLVPDQIIFVEQPPAPEQVREISLRHGGSIHSEWAPTECLWLLPLLAEHGLPEWMASVSWRESRCQPDARNYDLGTRDDSWGLFQINALGPLLREELRITCGVTDPSTLTDVETSVKCAANLFERYGYQPWHAGKYFR